MVEDKMVDDGSPQFLRKISTAFGTYGFHNGSVRSRVSFQFPPHSLKLTLWPSLFSSKHFIFVVGESQAAFTVHAAAIAKQSPALNILINGAMAEASDGKAKFEDVQEDTFVRFCQFAYTGDYTTPVFIHNPDVELPGVLSSLTLSQDVFTSDRDDSRPASPVLVPPAPAPEPEEEVVGWESKPKKTKNLSKSRVLRKSFDDKLYDVGIIHAISAARCQVRPNSSPTEDYTTVLLGHAQLYVFAEKWGIEALKTLALHKLHQTLASFTLYAARRPDIVELLRYAYSDKHTPDRVGAVDGLRSLVMLYTACEAGSLIHCPEFLSLIGEGGQLAQELVQMLMRRIE